jgi:hypothetical protein
MWLPPPFAASMSPACISPMPPTLLGPADLRTGTLETDLSRACQLSPANIMQLRQQAKLMPAVAVLVRRSAGRCSAPAGS